VTTQRELCTLLEDEFGVPCLRAPYGEGRVAFHGGTQRQHARGAIRDWLAGKRHEGEDGETVVCLVPARTDTRWWWESCRFGEIRFIKGRVRFEGEKSGAPFPSAVVVFGPRARCGECSWWNVQTGERFAVPVVWWEREVA